MWLNGLQFVHQSFPGDTSTRRRQKRVVHSNAARAAHAEARRCRTIEYQASKTRAAEGSQLSGSNDSGSGEVVASRMPRQLASGRKDPFTSFVRPFKPVEHFLLDYYVTAVVPLMRCNEPETYYVERMVRAWVPLALTDPGLLNSLFLTASRHLSGKYQQQQQQRFTELSAQYKLDCVRSLMESLSTRSSFDDATIAKSVMLAYDELTVYDAAMARNHLAGAVKMVQLNGGYQTLGLDGFLEKLICSLLLKFSGGTHTPPRLPRLGPVSTSEM
ncbi:Uu.00g097610.m01.CDS01 [Anthostomella pinea]|uniref:Uu.00g097610.m01.CDS01 n=1 Tax=Anthostomella pinea TaxID=933095 RepID=A0AAI8YF26_9PEZI|nr:Uu.00g097610.m01.CDS01 [Anthostomella pinea]